MKELIDNNNNLTNTLTATSYLNPFVDNPQALIDPLLDPTSLLAALGNTAQRGNEILREFNLRNVL